MEPRTPDKINLIVQRTPAEITDHYVLGPYPDHLAGDFLQVTNHNFNCNFNSSQFPDKTFLVLKEIDTSRKFTNLAEIFTESL